MDWTLWDPAGGEWLPMAGPMTVAAALRAAGRWKLDPPRRDFDAEAWTFRARFDAPANVSADTFLRFEGLATRAAVTLNDDPLFESDNMFVAHEAALAGRLRPSGNELRIDCAPLAQALLERRPRPRWRAPMVAHQQLRWHRTTLLGRTPGWSPPAAAVGPWRPVRLVQRGPLDMQQVRLRAGVEGRRGEVRCTIAQAPHVKQAELCLCRGGRTWRTSLVRDGEGFTGGLSIADADLWWPHTHGEPALYGAWLIVDGERLSLPAVGFRTMHVDLSDAFEIRVNGEPVFCRGAVWTPLDPVSLSASAADIERAVQQVRAAGMNMLRVPGTGVYEQDFFYEACDAAGVLVWQDFMFANMDYPAEDKRFRSSVELEVRQQLARIAPHPCVAVFCGNSEVEQQAAMWGAPRSEWQPRLFHEVIPQLVREVAPDSAYWPSSAHGGAFPHQADVGTSSYYGVGAYLRSAKDARLSAPRFATECLAFANVPQDAALARMPGGPVLQVHSPSWKDRSPRDLGAGWDFDDVRDHYLTELFGIDALRLRMQDPRRYLAVSRLASAEAMQAAFGEWRRPGSTCRGALVLMLRDLWAGAGWGVLDESGAPKACMYALTRSLQPLSVAITDEGMNGLAVHLLNETPASHPVQLELGAWLGETRVALAERRLDLAPRSAISIPAASLIDHFLDMNHACHFGPPPCDVVAVTLRNANGDVLSRAFHFTGGVVPITPRVAGLQARTEVVDANTARITVSAQSLAVGVHFDFGDARPSDEYFHLPPGGEASVLLHFPQGFRAGTVGAVNASDSVRVAIAPVAAEQRA